MGLISAGYGASLEGHDTSRSKETAKGARKIAVLNESQLVEAVGTIFKAGVPSITFMQLSRESAESYSQVLNSHPDYDAQFHGPSVKNDPIMRSTPYWAVTVRRIE